MPHLPLVHEMHYMTVKVTMDGAKHMSNDDKLRKLTGVTALDQNRLDLVWSDGTIAQVDISDRVNHPAFAALSDPTEFATVQVGDRATALHGAAESTWVPTRCGGQA
jgi:Protein of unknown function (DUF2442)